METEIWKDIPGYEGIYQVSSFGNVKSLSRQKIVNRKGFYITKEKLLSRCNNPTGHSVCVLFINGKGKTYNVHQLVAMAFLGHKPDGLSLVVDHIDNNPLNNTLNNLQIITFRENCSKDKKNGSSKYTGVCFYNNSNKWMASIWIDGRRKTLGYFKTEIEAHNVYQNELKKLSL